MSRLLKVALLLAMLAGCQDGGGTATRPEPMSASPRWLALHQAHRDRARRKGIDLLFLGDSITEEWSPSVWEEFYGKKYAANFGIGGDKTQSLLWRIDDGELGEIRPEIVVLLIGTNNLGENTTDEIAAGIRAVVARLQSHLPTSKILLLGLFPRGNVHHPDFEWKQETCAMDPRTREVNAKISSLDDGKSVRFLDLERVLLDDRGKVSKAIMPDFLHLSESAYRSWAEAMAPTLGGMMNEPSAVQSKNQ